MHIRYFAKSRYFYRSVLHTGVYPVWVAGLALGFAADRFCGDLYCGLLELAPLAAPDIWGLIVINVFPLLISAFAVSIYPYVLHILCLLRGMVLGMGLLGCVRLYGRAGLMMAGLLMFSLVFFSPVLLWYWNRSFLREKAALMQESVACLVLAMVFAWVDVGVIAPFLREIMIF